MAKAFAVGSVLRPSGSNVEPRWTFGQTACRPCVDMRDDTLGVAAPRVPDVGTSEPPSVPATVDLGYETCSLSSVRRWARDPMLCEAEIRPAVAAAMPAHALDDPLVLITVHKDHPSPVPMLLQVELADLGNKTCPLSPVRRWAKDPMLCEAEIRPVVAAAKPADVLDDPPVQTAHEDHPTPDPMLLEVALPPCALGVPPPASGSLPRLRQPHRCNLHQRSKWVMLLNHWLGQTSTRPRPVTHLHSLGVMTQHLRRTFHGA